MDLERDLRYFLCPFNSRGLDSHLIVFILCLSDSLSGSLVTKHHDLNIDADDGPTRPNYIKKGRR